MNTRKKKSLIILFLAILVVSCSKDKTYLSFSEFQKFSISENLTTDDPHELIQKTETLYFTDGELQSGTVKQVIPYYDNYTLECESNLSYTNTVVIMTGCGGEKATYIVNKEGFAVSCNVEESGLLRHYEFTYRNEYLCTVTETIDNTETFRMELFYNKGDLIKTTITRSDENNTLHFAPTPEKNVSRLPLLYLTEIYPLYFHKMAIYAGILGKAPQHLIQQITQENNVSDTANYSYKFSNEYIISCDIEIITGIYKSYRSIKFNYE
ncbi:MAG: DUF4595 domain-containing protein [Tannerella sp.]|nr:DUF4595 domain-containing protein [Tannerella sp.]